MAYFRSDIDIIVFFCWARMKMSGSAGLFSKKIKKFTSSGAQRWAGAGDGKHKKKYGHPYDITISIHLQPYKNIYKICYKL